MNEISLQHFVSDKGQTKAAEIIGCRQSSVSKMLKRKRDIRLVFDSNGLFVRRYEIKVQENNLEKVSA